ncbi:LysR family transcriptional regulator [Planctobacterium marinum]|uniref:LysR family transcriptional regulator n=1 Tax=Planctobacterium marinum TaxID=1631968 RepID=UPI001E2CC321|nr:LysR family transcriptional regulator [Planctobacterium marinum]MCC2607005.1 LysR family transcriptional regulator [Planctobacterium marinum]
MLERSDLMLIDAIDRLGTVTKAADELYLSQSAISHAIKRLETTMGVKFWKKSGRNLVLTPAGKRLLTHARRLLPQFEHIEQEISGFKSGVQGKLRIGMECYPCFQWLLKIVAPFLKAYPQVDVDVLKEFQFAGLAGLFNYDIDILVTPDPVFRPGLEFIPVFAYEQVLVVNSQHALLQKPFAEPRDLLQETLLSYPIEDSRLDIYTQFLLPVGGSVRKHKKIENTEIILQMVAANRGVTVLPRWLIEEHREQFDISALPLGNTGIHKQIYLGVREDSDPPKFQRDFVSLALEGKLLQP